MDLPVECPCRRFQSNTGLYEALNTATQNDENSLEFRELLDWISSGLHLQQQELLECTPEKGRCRNRVDCAYLVLNEVRQSCRPFLKSDKNTDSTTSKKKSNIDLNNPAEFPSLQTKKEKKRIRPAIVTSVPTTPWNNGSNLAHATSTVEPTAADFIKVQNNHEKQPESKLESVITDPSHREPPSSETMIDPNETPEELTQDVVLNNLATLYSLLMDSCLVPSSLDEIHLLLTLLSCNDEAKPLVCPTLFGETFRSVARCRFFATKVLQMQSSLLIHMVPCVPQLADCVILTDILPELNRNLVRKNSPKSMGPTRLSQRSAILTTPFQPARDSRHNFKTPHQQRAFKNREDTRDAFLYQLRDFLNVRGKILDAKQSQTAMERIQQSANGIVSKVHASNLPWFAEFFTDLLMQLGTVPIQETDPEVLTIADHEKLNALHRRFSTKTGSKKTVTQKLSASQKNDETPFKAARRYFTHHQEFFYLFVTSANSYTFTVHFRAALVRLARKQLQDSYTIGLDALCVLGRFLGVVVFSPNWKQPLGNEILQHESALDGLQLLGSCGLVLPALMEAPTLRHTFFAIELVSMAKWDYGAHLSPIYSHTLRILRGIQHRTFQKNITVYLSIELLFGEFCGLQFGSTVAHDPSELPLEQMDAPLWTHLDARVEELQFLIVELAGVGSPRHYGASRKLRPSTIDQNQTAQGLNSAIVFNAKGAFDLLPPTKSDGFLAKLGDTFFHQHADLKLICEFSINQTLSFVESHAQAECFKDVNNHEEASEEQLAHLQASFSKSLSDFLSNQLKEQTRGVLLALRPSLEAKVIDVAVLLSHSAGTSSAASMIAQLVAKEIEKRRQLLIKSLNNKPSADGKDKTGQSAKEKFSGEAVTILATTLLQVTNILKMEADQDNTRTVKEALLLIREILGVSPALENQTSKEDDVRELFAAVYQFLEQLSTLGRVVHSVDSSLTHCSLETFLTSCSIAVSICSFTKQPNQLLRGMFVDTGFEKLKKLAGSMDLAQSLDELLSEVIRA